MAETQAKRLDRIEEKIDKMTDAMISLARAEEKLIQIEKNNHAAFERLNRFSAKLDDIEKKVDNNARTVAVINRLFWIVAVAMSSVVISQHFPFV